MPHPHPMGALAIGETTDLTQVGYWSLELKSGIHIKPIFCLLAINLIAINLIDRA